MFQPMKIVRIISVHCTNNQLYFFFGWFKIQYCHTGPLSKIERLFVFQSQRRRRGRNSSLVILLCESNRQGLQRTTIIVHPCKHQITPFKPVPHYPTLFFLFYFPSSFSFCLIALAMPQTIGAFTSLLPNHVLLFPYPVYSFVLSLLPCPRPLAHFPLYCPTMFFFLPTPCIPNSLQSHRSCPCVSVFPPSHLACVRAGMMGGAPQGNSLAAESVHSLTSVGSASSKRSHKHQRMNIEDMLNSPGLDSGNSSGPEFIKNLEEKVSYLCSYMYV
jgi:hypothetical protein